MLVSAAVPMYAWFDHATAVFAAAAAAAAAAGYKVQ
jgi:hypothetical protein